METDRWERLDCGVCGDDSDSDSGEVFTIPYRSEAPGSGMLLGEVVDCEL